MDEHINKTIRVLHVTEVLTAAGIESFIMNNYRMIDRNKVQFDFMVLRNCEEYYDSEIASLGGKKYTIETNNSNTLSRVFAESRSLYKFLKEHPYDIIHIHYTTPLRALLILAAKKAGVKVRIYHSHSAAVSGKSIMKLVVYNFFRKKITKWATHYFACSEAAAQWMFDKKILNGRRHEIIYNGIDAEKFRFKQSERESVRKEFRLDDNYVLIHTGRFLEQKNHRFIIEVFKEVKRRCIKSKLLLVGTGELMEDIKNLVAEYQLTNDVIFFGVRSDVNRLLSASDCYIMPSLYEGLPVAAIEAECSGLPCVLSENITKEVELTSNVTFLSLTMPISMWSEKILEYRNVERRDCLDNIIQGGYDVSDCAKKLQKFYVDVLL